MATIFIRPTTDDNTVDFDTMTVGNRFYILNTTPERRIRILSRAKASAAERGLAIKTIVDATGTLGWFVDTDQATSEARHEALKAKSTRGRPRSAKWAAVECLPVGAEMYFYFSGPHGLQHIHNQAGICGKRTGMTFSVRKDGEGAHVKRTA